jgi:hypothetical protein
MKTNEKYSVVKKGIGEQILESGDINYFGFVVIRRKWFFNLLHSDFKYYSSGNNKNQSCWLYDDIYNNSYYKSKDDAILYLDIAIENYFSELKSKNVISYKETII